MNATEQALCPCGRAEHPAGHEFYVSAVSDSRPGAVALLLGPYPTHVEALEAVDLGRARAHEVDPRAPWYAYGTVSLLPADVRKPPVFGLGAPR